MSETLRKYGAKYNTTFCSLCGLSTDTKPTGSFNGIGIANGSEFIEMDTNKKYLYDEEHQQWNLTSSGGGGGSATLIEKSITENGEYLASADGADGYSKVTVDVAGGGGETFEVEMTLTTVDRSVSIVTSKTLQETLDAIEAGKQISFSATYDGRRAEVVCYGVWDLQLGTGDSITMLLYDGVGEFITVYWVGDGNLVGIIQGTVYLAGVSL